MGWFSKLSFGRVFADRGKANINLILTKLMALLYFIYNDIFTSSEITSMPISYEIIKHLKHPLIVLVYILIAAIIWDKENWLLFTFLIVFFTLAYVYIETKTPKYKSDSPDAIPDEDLPVIRQEIKDNLTHDLKSLRDIIPMLKVDGKQTGIPDQYKLNTITGPILNYLRHLRATPRAQIENKDIINRICNWFDYSKDVNNQFSMTNTSEYINTRESLLITSVSELINHFSAEKPR